MAPTPRSPGLHCLAGLLLLIGCTAPVEKGGDSGASDGTDASDAGDGSDGTDGADGGDGDDGTGGSDGEDDGDEDPVDADGDGHPEDTDCNDADPAVFPGADELCNGIDDDCDDRIDNDPTDGVDAWIDSDGDGYGDPASLQAVCELLDGLVDNGGDCDDSDAAVSPDALEDSSNGIDDDCDGQVVQGISAVAHELSAGAGPGTLASLGLRLAVGADVTGDGQPELLVGAPDSMMSDGSGGAAFVWQGPTTAASDTDGAAVRVAGGDSVVFLGMGLAAGDWNGDGVDDLLLGAADELSGSSGDQDGLIYLFYGPLSTGSDLTADDADRWFYGSWSGGLAGHTLAAGDFDGDGVDALVIGAPRAENPASGELSVITEASADATASRGTFDAAAARITGGAAFDFIGVTISVADLDGDGVDELLHGRPGDTVGTTDNSGSIRIHSAAGSGFVDAGTWTGPEEGAGIGGRPFEVVDHNGDGYADLFVGAPSGSSGLGAAWLVPGPLVGGGSIPTAATAELEGATLSDHLGSAVVASVDADGDGALDLVATAPERLVDGSSWAGLVYVFQGPVSGTRTATDAEHVLQGSVEDGLLGQAAVGAGDLTGDGGATLVLGEPGADGGAGRLWLLGAGALGL